MSDEQVQGQFRKNCELAFVVITTCFYFGIHWGSIDVAATASDTFETLVNSSLPIPLRYQERILFTLLGLALSLSLVLMIERLTKATSFMRGIDIIFSNLSLLVIILLASLISLMVFGQVFFN